LGARKILVANVGPIGCIPYQRDTNPAAGDNCVSFSNQIAQLYNTELRSLVTELGANLEGSNFVYADVYRIVNDILQNYRSYGLTSRSFLDEYVDGVCVLFRNKICNFVLQDLRTQMHHAAMLPGTLVV
jgi:phospholipase/lecithinase/hemolysin